MPVIRVDNEVFKELQNRAEPLVDTPNAVLRRVLGLEVVGGQTEPSGRQPVGVEPEKEAKMVGKMDMVHKIVGKAKAKQIGEHDAENLIAAFLEDKPEAIERVNALLRPRRGRRSRSRGIEAEFTPQGAYRIPILRMVDERFGGSAPRPKALDHLRRLMSLKPADFGELKHGQVRWTHMADWERRRMVQEGLLSGRSPRGVWEITDEGRRYQQRYGNS